MKPKEYSTTRVSIINYCSKLSVSTLNTKSENSLSAQLTLSQPGFFVRRRARISTPFRDRSILLRFEGQQTSHRRRLHHLPTQEIQPSSARCEATALRNRRRRLPGHMIPRSLLPKAFSGRGLNTSGAGQSRLTPAPSSAFSPSIEFTLARPYPLLLLTDGIQMAERPLVTIRAARTRHVARQGMRDE